MKKRISGIIALLACLTCFAGCDAVGGAWDKVTNVAGGAWDKVTGLFDKTEYNAQGAADYLEAVEVEKNEETRNDYTVPNTWTYMGVTYTVEWSVNVTAGVTLERGETETTVNVDEMLTEDLTYVLTAKVIAGDKTSAEVSFERVVLAMPDTVAAPITAAPVAGVAYKYYVYQAGAQQDCYFKGSMDGYYFATTKNYEEGVDIYVEYVTGSTTEFYPYFNHPDDGSKQYIGVKLSSDNAHNNIVFEDAPVCSFVWDDDLKTITTVEIPCVIEDQLTTSKFYLGNYTDTEKNKDYTTISASPVTRAEDSTSYVGSLVELVSRENVLETEKLAQTKRNFSVSSYYFGTGTVELPTMDSTFPDVTMTYAISGEGATLEGNVLTYTAGAADLTATLTVTFSCGSETPVTKDCSFTVSPIPTVPADGTTLSITDVIDLADSLKAYGNGYNGGKTSEIYTISGIVTSIKSDWNPEYNNMDVYISDDVNGTNSILVYRLGTQVAEGDVITVTGKLGYYNGSAQVAQGATAEITGQETLPTVETLTVTEALEVADGATVKVSGTVSTVNYSWSDSNKNMSVTITDGTNTLYIFKLASKVALGDIITVEGTMATYNGAKQIAAGATAVVTGKAEVEYTEMTIAEALAAADDTLVEVTGTVSTINYSWSDTSGNMSVTITDGTNTLYIYKLETKVAEGDNITVKGCMDTYNNARQIAAGATAVINTNTDNPDDDEPETPVDPNPETPKYQTLTIPEAVTLGSAQDHNSYTAEPYYVVGLIVTIKSAKYGNCIILDEQGNTIEVYGIDGDNGENYENITGLKPVVGDVVKFLSVIGRYNSTPQLKDAKVSEILTATDAQKVAAEKYLLYITANYKGVTEIELPSSTLFTDVSLTWSVKDNDSFTITDAKLDVSDITETVNLVLVATFTSGEEEDTKEFNITVEYVAPNTPITTTVDFSAVNNDSSYGARDFLNGWTATDAAVQSGGSGSNPIQSTLLGSDTSVKAVCLMGKTSNVGSLSSSILNGGLSKISFNYGYPFNESKGVSLKVKILDESGNEIASKDCVNSTLAKNTAAEFSWDVSSLNITGNFKIVIVNNSPSNSTSNADRFTIWNLQWTNNPTVAG